MPTTVEAPTPTRRLEVIDQEATYAEPVEETQPRLGPLLAVCGLAGGAGTTTLAYLVALAAAGESNEPVLVADTGGPSGGLAALAGVRAPRSLPELASDFAAGVAVQGGLYATGPAGVRVLASGPVFSAEWSAPPLRRLLIDAREAHRLTVIDCGTMSREIDQAAAAAATHLAWVLPTTDHAVSRARAVLREVPDLSACQILVARADVRARKASVNQLRGLADERRAPLVLVPHLAELEIGKLDRAIQTAQVPVQAILGALKR